MTWEGTEFQLVFVLVSMCKRLASAGCGLVIVNATVTVECASVASLYLLIGPLGN